MECLKQGPCGPKNLKYLLSVPFPTTVVNPWSTDVGCIPTLAFWNLKKRIGENQDVVHQILGKELNSQHLVLGTVGNTTRLQVQPQFALLLPQILLLLLCFGENDYI